MVDIRLVYSMDHMTMGQLRQMDRDIRKIKATKDFYDKTGYDTKAVLDHIRLSMSHRQIQVGGDFNHPDEVCDTVWIKNQDDRATERFGIIQYREDLEIKQRHYRESIEPPQEQKYEFINIDESSGY